ncbi:MAG: YidC/Oxa1 family membrane protein insertase [Eubacteriales bacterium]
MLGILLTKNTTFIIGPVAELLGYLMDGIFNVLDMINIPNVGLSIILFTILINLIMLPLTIKQQKFSKFSAKMNPELQVVRKKYEGKKDNESMMAMNQETQAVYAKYGVSPMGSCLPLLIQMPILFALYRVIYAMPAYVTKMKIAFDPLVEKISTQQDIIEYIRNFSTSAMYSKQYDNELFLSGNMEYIQNTIIDSLNMASSSDFESLKVEFPTLASDVVSTLEKLNIYNNFLGLNMSNSPSYTILNSFSTGEWLAILGALMIPLFAALTQWINTKLMPQAAMSDDPNNSMVASMKMMNNIMPIMSAVFCFSFPAGMGLYWIAGSVVRSVQQVVINKHIDKLDIDALIEKNVEKNNKKREKLGLPPQSTTNANIPKLGGKSVHATKSSTTKEEREAAVKKASEYYDKNGNSGSIASKANMVKQFNERNNK